MLSLACFAITVQSLPNSLAPPAPTITKAPLLERAYLANFIGWSSADAQGDSTRYASLRCDTSLSYGQSVYSGTTYAQCCDVGNSDCATSIFAMSCVNNLEMAGTVTLRDCGPRTCATALIYQNYGDTLDPIRWHGCQYSASAGTWYRTLPPNASPTARPASASSQSHGLAISSIAFIVFGSLVGLILVMYAISCCLARRIRKSKPNQPRQTKHRKQVQPTAHGQSTASNGNVVAPPAPPTVVKHYWFAPFARFTTSDGRKPRSGIADAGPVGEQPPCYDEIPVKKTQV